MRMLAVVLGMLVGASASAQQLSMSRADGEVVVIAPGQFVILKEEGGGVVVDNVLLEGSATERRVEVAPRDRITALNEKSVTSLARFVAEYRAIAAGSAVTLSLTRNDSLLKVRFMKPSATPGDQRLVTVRDKAGAPAGAWATAGAGAASGVARVVIAGVHIVENDQGMPEVEHRAAHPASATVALRVGDVITAIDGKSIAALAGLEMMYSRVDVGSRVRLSVRRGGASIDIEFAKPANK